MRQESNTYEALINGMIAFDAVRFYHNPYGKNKILSPESLKLRAKSQLIALSALSGLLSGLAAAAFLYLLEWATTTRESNPTLVWGLPAAGLLIGLAYWRAGQNVAAGHNLILDEIHEPKTLLPLRMAPLILGGTILTHLFGGSAGREGTAVQMGATLSDSLSRVFPISIEERKVLLSAGMGAGFAAAIGTPWAGAIFGMEVIRIGKFRLFAVAECLAASFTGYWVTKALGAPHSIFPAIELPSFAWLSLFWIALAGIAFGLSVRVFTALTHLIERSQTRIFAPLRPLLFGLLIVGLYQLVGTYRYAGLGIPVIQESLLVPATFLDPAFKTLFTALTVGSGFKGGEFIPLVFIGSTLGSALSTLIPLSFSLLAAVGFAAVFAGAANTPFACSLMAMELFGPALAPYAFVGCFVSYFASGHRGIYRSQKIHRRKRIWSIVREIKAFQRKRI